MAESTHMTHNSSSNRQNWRTPHWLFNAVQVRFGLAFNVDAAADRDNRLCDRFYSRANPFVENYKPLEGDVIWCNPPFNKKKEFLQCFIEKVKAPSVVLLPSDTGASWFHYGLKNASQVVLMEGRVSFIDPVSDKPIPGNPAPSVLFLFNTRPGPLVTVKTKTIKDMYVNDCTK